jgi:prepilin signal peptidase PulO-like enzyme (type II secretory pathway)
MGGADSKALMCLGLALPVAPSLIGPLWKSPLASFYPFPIAILVNSFILSVGSILFLLGRNLTQRIRFGKGLFRGFEKESLIRKLLIMITCYKTSFNILESKPYLFPAEQVEVVDTEPVRHFHVISSAETDRDKLVSSLQNYKDRGLFSDGVWVTPGLPHLVFITASLILTVFVADLLMWIFLKTMGVA